MNAEPDHLTLLRRAVREPISGMTAAEIDTVYRAKEIISDLQSEIVERPFAEIALKTDAGAGRFHEQCREIVELWPPDEGVLSVIDEENAEEHGAYEFWTGMNALREAWEALNCHIVFFLLPASYLRLLHIADHLADWMPLKLHLIDRPKEGYSDRGMDSGTSLFSEGTEMSPKAALKPAFRASTGETPS